MKKTNEKTSVSLTEKALKRCLIVQCFAVGAWLMLLLVCVGVGFALSSEIGTYATYIVCVFLTVAIIEVCGWEKRLVGCRPETTCLKQSSEKMMYVHRVSVVITAAAWLALAAAVVMMAFFGFKTADKPVNVFLTDIPMYAIGVAWLIQLAFFIYDAVSLRLFLRAQVVEDEKEKAEL